MNLTNEEIKNIIVLINRASVSGAEATTTAILLQKLNGMVATSEVTGTKDLESPSSEITEPESIKSVEEMEK